MLNVSQNTNYDLQKMVSVTENFFGHDDWKYYIISEIQVQHWSYLT